jgi:hypothetical protein
MNLGFLINQSEEFCSLLLNLVFFMFECMVPYDEIFVGNYESI